MGVVYCIAKKTNKDINIFYITMDKPNKRRTCRVYGVGFISHQKNIRKKTAWTITNTTTIVDWVIASNLYILLMDTYLTYLKKILRVNTLWSLLISSITSTISITQFTINEADSPQLSLMVKSAIFTTSVITSLITGYIKVEKIQERIEYIDATRQKWLNFMLSLTSELQVGAKLRSNAEDIIKDKRNIFNHLSSKRIDIPHHVQLGVSKFLTQRVRRKNNTEQCTCFTKYFCCGCVQRCDNDKKYIELTQQNLSIYKMINKLLEEELLLLGKIYSDTIKHITFHGLTDLFEYHIETNDVEMCADPKCSNDYTRSFSPVSSDDGDEFNECIHTNVDDDNGVKSGVTTIANEQITIDTPTVDIENVILNMEHSETDGIELISHESNTSNAQLSPSDKFVKSMKEFIDASANAALDEDNM